MDRRALETSRLSPGEQAKVVIQKLLHVQHLHDPSAPQLLAIICQMQKDSLQSPDNYWSFLLSQFYLSVTEPLDVHYSSDFTSMW